MSRAGGPPQAHMLLSLPTTLLGNNDGHYTGNFRISSICCIKPARPIHRATFLTLEFSAGTHRQTLAEGFPPSPASAAQMVSLSSPQSQLRTLLGATTIRACRCTSLRRPRRVPPRFYSLILFLSLTCARRVAQLTLFPPVPSTQSWPLAENIFAILGDSRSAQDRRLHLDRAFGTRAPVWSGLTLLVRRLICLVQCLAPAEVFRTGQMTRAPPSSHRLPLSNNREVT